MNAGHNGKAKIKQITIVAFVAGAFLVGFMLLQSSELEFAEQGNPVAQGAASSPPIQARESGTPVNTDSAVSKTRVYTSSQEPGDTAPIPTSRVKGFLQFDLTDDEKFEVNEWMAANGFQSLISTEEFTGKPSKVELSSYQGYDNETLFSLAESDLLTPTLAYMKHTASKLIPLIPIRALCVAEGKRAIGCPGVPKSL